MTVIGSTNKNVFETYIDQILVPQLRPGAIVLMDNLSVHKGSRIQELISSTGAKLIFLPAYSSDLSPIETMLVKIQRVSPLSSSSNSRTIRSSYQRSDLSND